MNSKAVNKLRHSLLKEKLDGLILTNPVNMGYLSGFSGEAQAIITPTKKILIIDSRFEEQAAKEKTGFRVHLRPQFAPLQESLFHLIKRLKLKRVGFEASSLSYGFYKSLEKCPGRVKFLPTKGLVELIRAVKSPQEIRLIKKAALIALKAFEFAKRSIRPGIEETDLSRKIQYFMRKSGAEDSAFQPIIASGKRGAMPHAPLSRRRIKRNEAVLLDLGCRVSSYNSDLTRMVFLGKINRTLKCIYALVQEAQLQAIKAVKAGAGICQIDSIARQYLSRKGYGRFFGHALGHGIGREVHEYPSVSPVNKDILREGMVITIEPGVYIPGLGGIRIEDMVLVTRHGCRVLTTDR